MQILLSGIQLKYRTIKSDKLQRQELIEIIRSPNYLTYCGKNLIALGHYLL